MSASDQTTVDGTFLKVPLEPLIQSMSLDKKREMLAWLATDAEVVDAVVDAICGEDEFGWGMGDPDRRIKILSRVEDTQLRAGLAYNWTFWDVARQKIKDIRSQEHLYWVLYHRLDLDLSRRVFDELRRLGVESNYRTTIADEEVAAVKSVLEEALKSMAPDRAAEGGAE